jgi:hypothetical protein
MSVRTDFRDDLASTVKDALDGLGDTATYIDEGTTVSGLTVHPGAESKELAEVLGLRAEKTARKFMMPRQTGFPPTAGITIRSRITFDSKDYDVERWEDISGGYEAVFRLYGSRDQAADVGK